MPNDVDKYLGPHRKIGPDSYELAPYPIVGKWESDIKFGGGYNSWGLNEGPRRGEGGPRVILVGSCKKENCLPRAPRHTELRTQR